MHRDDVTICKALAIMLMVLGHSGVPIGEHFIYMFHMPVFFFLSGYCSSYKDNLTGYLRKKMIHLYIPFIKWNLIFLLLHNVMYELHLYDCNYGGGVIHMEYYSVHDYFSKFINIVFIMQDSEALIGGFWFIRELFLGSLVSFLILHKESYRRLLVLLFLVISVIVVRMNWLCSSQIITNQTLLATLFIILGFYIKNLDLHKYLNNIKITIGAFVLVVIGSYISPTNMLDFNYMNVIPYILFAFVGSLMLLNFSVYIQNLNFKVANNILYYIGSNTLVILTFHLLSFKIINTLRVLLYDLDARQIAEYPFIRPVETWFIAYFLIGIILPLTINVYGNKLFSKRKFS